MTFERNADRWQPESGVPLSERSIGNGGRPSVAQRLLNAQTRGGELRTRRQSKKLKRYTKRASLIRTRTEGRRMADLRRASEASQKRRRQIERESEGETALLFTVSKYIIRAI